MNKIWYGFNVDQLRFCLTATTSNPELMNVQSLSTNNYIVPVHLLVWQCHTVLALDIVLHKLYWTKETQSTETEYQ